MSCGSSLFPRTDARFKVLRKVVPVHSLIFLQLPYTLSVFLASFVIPSVCAFIVSVDLFFSLCFPYSNSCTVHISVLLLLFCSDIIFLASFEAPITCCMLLHVSYYLLFSHYSYILFVFVPRSSALPFSRNFPSVRLGII